MNRIAIAAAVLVGVPATAHAFCGFYVAGNDQKLFNDATEVVLMRDGTRTVLSMQNNYKGPPEAFAMVIPVPTVLHEGDVKTLPKDVFDRVDKMGAPRLVEYWEQDPCQVDREYDRRRMVHMSAAGGPPPPAAMPARDLGVTIEAKFAVGEYQIVILSAKDSTGLDTWLHQEKYQIPAGAEPLLRPYVENGMKFFVAKVDPQKVQFVDGRAALSPLRFHYDSDDFNLPIRLGLANSSGTQDLIVNILAPHQRYEVANYPNVTIPTNIDVKDSVKDRFASFYTSLFDKTVEKNPGAVVTEYAWQATTCDPCPGPTLNYADFTLLGSDVLTATPAPPPTQAPPTRPGVMRRPMPPRPGFDLVLTRLHARYGTDIKDDLHFKAATPIVGGREHVVKDGKLEEGAEPSSVNNFQGRYAIRHWWTGAIACQSPRRGIWGGPPGGAMNIQPATGLAFAPRNAVDLAAAVNRDVPEISLKASEIIGAPKVPTNATKPDTKPDSPKDPKPDAKPDTTAPKAGGGCCDGSGAPGSTLVGLLVLGLLVIPRAWTRRPRWVRAR
jgi:hypothetical protein